MYESWLVIDRKLLFSRTARRVSFFAQRRDFQHGASLFMENCFLRSAHFRTVIRLHPHAATFF
jgi:hypothetical protein